MLPLGRSLGPIPWKRPTEEVDENVCEQFEIVTARLFHTEVTVKRGICNGAHKDMIVLSEWDMCMGSSVSVLIGKTKIDDVDLLAMKTCTDQKIGRLDIMVNEVGRVDAF